VSLSLRWANGIRSLVADVWIEVQILTWYRDTGSGRSWSDRERYSVFRGMVSRGVVSVGAGIWVQQWGYEDGVI
jgi:hypothetical protein